MSTTSGMSTRSSKRKALPESRLTSEMTPPTPPDLVNGTDMEPTEEIRWLMKAIDAWLQLHHDANSQVSLTVTETAFIHCFHQDYRVSGYMANIAHLRHFVRHTQVPGITITRSGDIVYHKHELVAPTPDVKTPPVSNIRTPKKSNVPRRSKRTTTKKAKTPIGQNVSTAKTPSYPAKDASFGSIAKYFVRQEEIPNNTTPHIRSISVPRSLNFDESDAEENTEDWNEVPRKLRKSRVKKPKGIKHLKDPPRTPDDPPHPFSQMPMDSSLDTTVTAKPPVPTTEPPEDTVQSVDKDEDKSLTDPGDELVDTDEELPLLVSRREYSSSSSSDDSVDTAAMRKKRARSKMALARKKKIITDHPLVTAPTQLQLSSTGIAAPDALSQESSTGADDTRKFTKMAFLDTQEYQDLFHDIKEQVTLAIRGDVRAAVASNSPEVNQYHHENAETHWAHLHGDLEKTKQRYTEHLEKEIHRLDRREANMDRQQRKLDEEIRRMDDRLRSYEQKMDAITTKATSHIRNTYNHHTETWERRHTTQTQQDATDREAQVTKFNEQLTQRMNLLQTEKESLRNLIVETTTMISTLNNKTATAEKSVATLDNAIQKATILAGSLQTQIDDQADALMGHQSVISFQTDEHAILVADETQKFQHQVAQQVEAWVTIEKSKATTEIRELIATQISTGVENARGLLQADLDSLEPMAKEMMQKSLLTYKQDIDKVRQQKTPIRVETVDEATDEAINAPPPASGWRRPLGSEQKGGTNPAVIANDHLLPTQAASTTATVNNEQQAASTTATVNNDKQPHQPDPGTRWNVNDEVRTALQHHRPVGAPDGTTTAPTRHSTGTDRGTRQLPARQDRLDHHDYSSYDRSDRLNRLHNDRYDRSRQEHHDRSGHARSDTDRYDRSRQDHQDRYGQENRSNRPGQDRYDRSGPDRYDPNLINPYQRDKNHSYFRKSTVPTMITATDAQAMKKEYCSFQDFCTVYDVPLVDWSILHADITSLYPQDQDASKYQMYSKMIYQKLEEDGTLDIRGNHLLQGLMAQYNGTRDGYAVLKEMVRRYATQHNKADSAIRNTQPVFQDSDIFSHAGALTTYYEYQEKQGRTWEPIEKTTLFLEAIKHDDQFGTYAQEILRLLRLRPLHAPMEVDYELASLPTTLVRTKDQTEKGASNPYTINAMRSGRDAGRGRDTGRSSDRKDWKSQPWKPKEQKDWKYRRDGDDKRQPRERRDRPHVQCAACGVYGHDSDTCHVCPKVLSCIQFERKYPDKAKKMMDAHRKRHHPANQQSPAKRQIMNQLVAYLDKDDADTMAKDLLAKVATLNMFEEVDDLDDWQDPFAISDDEYDQENPTADGSEESFTKVANRMQVTAFLPTDVAEQHAFAQSAVLPPKELLQRCERASAQSDSALRIGLRDKIAHSREQRRIIKKLVRFDPRTGKLTDSGANCSATSELHLIHEYKHGSRYNLTDFRGTVKPATGEGYILMENCEGTVDRIFVLYDPDVEGTIISPEHHTVTNPLIHRWVQSSTPSENGGRIMYYDATDKVVSSYQTVRHDGLYYMRQTTIHPPVKVHKIVTQDTHAIPIQVDPQATPSALDVTEDEWRTFMDAIDDDDDVDIPHSPIAMDLDPLDVTIDDWQHVMTLQPVTPVDEPILTHVCSKKMAVTTLTPTEQALLEYERWHQRLGHVGRKKIKATSNWTTGVPDINLDKVLPPDVEHCRACAKAKLQKAPKGPNMDTTNLKTSQRFQMDLGFMRGPSNLKDVVEREDKPKMKMIKSRQGFTCYLLIIDAKSRYIWVFLLRSKHAPVKLIDRFLTTHGRHDNTDVRTIRTDGDGALAGSCAFRAMCLHKHGYVVEPTGPDSSSQNGRSERPHKTLAIMVRCMLYASLLGVDFWADALVYAVYLYVRLHHSSIDMSPFYAYTGKKARGDQLRTFGSYVTVKRPGDRNTKLDPNHYDGRFLRFSATEKNIVYYDEVTGKEKLARHLTLDEFHYGANERPPGAQAVMDIVSPNRVVGGDKLKELPITVEDDTTTPLTPPEFFGSEMLDAVTPTDPPAIAAAAAKLTVTQERILHLEHSNDMFGDPIPIQLTLRDKNPTTPHPHLGFKFRSDPDTDRVYLETCVPGSTAAKIPRWRTRVRFANLRSVDGNPIQSLSHLTDYIANARQKGVQQLRFVFAHLDTSHSADDGVPQLHLDQLRVVRRLQTELKVSEARARQNRKPTLSAADQDRADQAAQKKFSRKHLRKRADFDLWKKAEWAQHDKYETQNMFGTPIPRPRDATVLPWVWQRHWKEDATAAEKGEYIRKCRATCDGGPRYGRAVTLAETYATCIEQSASRVFWALVSVLGFVAYGADAGNAFAEAPPPVSPFYMEVDDAYREWWTEHKGNAPIPDGYVLPVRHALQGHPESPRLWEKHITQILENMGYVATTHERCLYYRTTDAGDLILIIRQVDDFAVASTDRTVVEAEITKIGEELLVPLNHLGLIKKFNGVDILQTRDYVKVSCESYITKMIETHGWQDLVAANKPIPMRSDSKYMAMLETSELPATDTDRKDLEKQMQFSFRSVIGEMVFAMVIARPDLSFAITKLSQWNKNPAKCHYQAAKQACVYLNATKDDGLVYWRTEPRHDLPYVEPPKPVSNPDDWLPQIPMDPTKLVALTDSDWGSDRVTRRSVSGMVIMLAGAAVLYRTRFQPTIALSSTEAEFVAGSDTGKAVLYLRSILYELGLTQQDPTQIFQDNHGAIHMANAQAPTRRTRHVELRHFAILQWVENGDITMVPIGTDNNHSDAMTKAIGRTKFHQHADVYMGKVPPTYVTAVNTMRLRPKVQRLSAQPNCLIHAVFDPEF